MVAVGIFECLVCREYRGDVAIPGGFLINDETVVACHCPPLPEAKTPYLGYLFVTSQRHVPSFAELRPDEAAAMGTAIATLSAALKSKGADHVYVCPLVTPGPIFTFTSCRGGPKLLPKFPGCMLMTGKGHVGATRKKSKQ